MRILGSIAATERLHQPNDLSAFLESGSLHRQADQVTEQWIRSHEDLRARHENPKEAPSKLREERDECRTVFD